MRLSLHVFSLSLSVQDKSSVHYQQLLSVWLQTNNAIHTTNTWVEGHVLCELTKNERAEIKELPKDRVEKIARQLQNEWTSIKTRPFSEVAELTSCCC